MSARIALTAVAASVALLSACSGTSGPGTTGAPAPAATGAPSPSTTAPPAGRPGAAPTPILAKPADDGDRARVAAIDKVAYMVGEWEGDGWVMTKEKGRTPYTQREKIERQLMGDLLTVRGTALPPGGAEDTALFNAFALLGFDPQGKQYVWRAYSSQSHGHAIETPLTVTPDGWSWEYKPDPSAPITIRNTARFTDGSTTWTETSEMSRDGGKTWQPTMSMTLKKRA